MEEQRFSFADQIGNLAVLAILGTMGILFALAILNSFGPLDDQPAGVIKAAADAVKEGTGGSSIEP